MSASPWVRNIHAPSSSKSLLYQELIPLILDILEQYDTFEPTQEQLKETYSRYQKRWASTSIQKDVTIPLLGFTSDHQQPVQVSSHFQLAPFTPEEKTQVWNQSLDIDDLLRQALLPPVKLREFCLASFKLTGSHIEKGDTHEGDQELMEELQRIISALRLVHAGDIKVQLIFRTNPMIESSKSSSFTDSPNHRPIKTQFAHLKTPYVLSQTDLPIVQELCESLHKLGEQKRGLEVALRRFNQVYERTDLEDRIIDLTIALESCLLAGLKEELNYRLALRGTALLAQTNIWEPEKAQSLLKAMYAIRSAIVHEGQQLSRLGKDQKKMLQKLEIAPHEFPSRCEDVVRDILRTYVIWLAKGSGSVQTICGDLDQYIPRDAQRDFVTEQ
jgi:Apea-like HEPN